MPTPYFDTDASAGPGDGTGGGSFVFANNGSTNQSGEININTGTPGTPTANSVVGTIVWRATAEVPESCGPPDPKNAAAFGVMNDIWFSNISSTGFTINVGATALTGSTSYLFGYKCK